MYMYKVYMVSKMSVYIRRCIILQYLDIFNVFETE